MLVPHTIVMDLNDVMRVGVPSGNFIEGVSNSGPTLLGQPYSSDLF